MCRKGRRRSSNVLGWLYNYMVRTLLINHSEAGVCGGVCVASPHPHRWPALQAGCQPGVSWSMLVKRALIWVWQGNQQPNSTVKLNSAVEHRSASFMLRLQKGKVPQHQFVTERCGTELTLTTELRGREGGRKWEEGGENRSVCLCLCVVKTPCRLRLHPHQLPTTAGKEKDLLQMRGREEKADRERGRRGAGLLQGSWTTWNTDS